MAPQNPNPGPWHDFMSDGCTGVLNLGYKIPCTRHDEAQHRGGTVAEKLAGDDRFHADMCARPGFWGWAARHGIADIRYHVVRKVTYNYPPGHPMRSNFPKLETWNWLPAYPEGWRA